MEPFGTRYAGVDRSLNPLFRERRRAVRQKIHTPAYARLIGDLANTGSDLCEVLDISEQGIAIKTSFSGNRSRILNLSLDLSETGSCIRTTGHVIWADYAGRLGIHFPELTETARKQLREWLFLNAMAAAVNHVARTQLDEPNVPDLPAAAVSRPVSRKVDRQAADYTTILAALAAVQREVDSLGGDLHGALQLIADRARALTRANGAAIAFSDHGEMLCLASAGNAPSVGTMLERGIGFSGLCIDTGMLQRCDDAENDVRVDRASCKMLGIRSMVAVPVRLGNSVVGLLEVFSDEAYAFSDHDGRILQRLVETILAAVNRAARYRSSTEEMEATPIFSPSFMAPADYPFASTRRDLPGGDVGVPRRHLILLISVAVMIVAVLIYLMIPWVGDAWRALKHSQSTAVQAKSAPLTQPAKKEAARSESLEEVRARANAGDPYEQFSMGTRYATGEDVPQDYAAAAHWFLLAAEQGHAMAQDNIGAYYWAGRGVPKDVNRAYYWSVLARAGGSEASEIRVAFLTSHLTRSQVLSIQQEANKFLHDHPPIRGSAPPR
jgi:GAF domain-containing protein